MPKRYPLHEAKAQLSRLVREARAGETVTITVHGEPVAELRALPMRQTIEERMEELRRNGELIEEPLGPGGERLAFKVGKRVPGALAAFLRDRE